MINAGEDDTNAARQCVSFRQLPPGWLWKHLCPQLARTWKQHVDNCYRPLKVKGFSPTVLLWITSTNRFINQALRIYLPRYLFWIYSPAPSQYNILLLLLLHGMFTSGDEVWYSTEQTILDSVQFLGHKCDSYCTHSWFLTKVLCPIFFGRMSVFLCVFFYKSSIPSKSYLIGKVELFSR